jgi:hypothetical protein
VSKETVLNTQPYIVSGQLFTLLASTIIEQFQLVARCHTITMELTTFPPFCSMLSSPDGLQDRDRACCRCRCSSYTSCP